jgi:hypothetical protein
MQCQAQLRLTLAASPRRTVRAAEVPSQPQLRHAPDAQAVDFLPFEEARQKARQLVNLHDVTSELEYKEAVAMRMEGTEGLPLHADFYYLRKGWQYWEDFLGQPGDHGVWLEYEEARRAVLDAGVQSEAQFRELLMANDPRLRGVPINPATGYKNSGWISWHAWLGKGVKQNFEGAKRAVRPLCLKDREHFELLLKRGLLPAGMPTDPYMQYKKDFYKTHKTESYDGFWKFFLKGNYDRSDPEALQPKQLPYLTSRRYLERYVKPKITTPEEYAQWAAEDESERGKWEGKVPRPLSVPFKPEEAYYRRGWRTWVDFLGMEDPDARWAVKLMQRRQRREYKALKIEERGIKPHDDLLKKVMHMVDGPYLPTEQDKEDDEMVTLAGYDSEKGREEESFDEEDEETEHNQRA